MDSELLKAQLLYKLYRRGIWGGKHTPLRNLYHLVDKMSVRESEKSVKELNNLGWIHMKKSTGELHISLNSHKKKEIREFILNILKIDPDLLK